jgi:hypothetical protein
VFASDQDVMMLNPSGSMTSTPEIDMIVAEKGGETDHGEIEESGI